jgi:hypothetical protein
VTIRKPTPQVVAIQCPTGYSEWDRTGTVHRHSPAMTTIRYIRAIGTVISRRLWATCKFGSLETLKSIWADYTSGKIDSAEYHQLAADLLA